MTTPSSENELSSSDYPTWTDSYEELEMSVSGMTLQPSEHTDSGYYSEITGYYGYTTYDSGTSTPQVPSLEVLQKLCAKRRRSAFLRKIKSWMDPRKVPGIFLMIGTAIVLYLAVLAGLIFGFGTHSNMSEVVDLPNLEQLSCSVSNVSMWNSILLRNLSFECCGIRKSSITKENTIYTWTWPNLSHLGRIQVFQEIAFQKKSQSHFCLANTKNDADINVLEESNIILSGNVIVEAGDVNFGPKCNAVIRGHVLLIEASSESVANLSNAAINRLTPGLRCEASQLILNQGNLLLAQRDGKVAVVRGSTFIMEQRFSGQYAILEIDSMSNLEVSDNSFFKSVGSDFFLNESSSNFSFIIQENSLVSMAQTFFIINASIQIYNSNITEQCRGNCKLPFVFLYNTRLAVKHSHVHITAMKGQVLSINSVTFSIANTTLRMEGSGTLGIAGTNKITETESQFIASFVFLANSLSIWGASSINIDNSTLWVNQNVYIVHQSKFSAYDSNVTIRQCKDSGDSGDFTCQLVLNVTLSKAFVYVYTGSLTVVSYVSYGGLLEVNRSICFFNDASVMNNGTMGITDASLINLGHYTNIFADKASIIQLSSTVFDCGDGVNVSTSLEFSNSSFISYKGTIKLGKRNAIQVLHLTNAGIRIYDAHMLHTSYLCTDGQLTLNQSTVQDVKIDNGDSTITLLVGSQISGNKDQPNSMILDQFSTPYMTKSSLKMQNEGFLKQKDGNIQLKSSQVAIGNQVTLDNGEISVHQSTVLLNLKTDLNDAEIEVTGNSLLCLGKSVCPEKIETLTQIGSNISVMLEPGSQISVENYTCLFLRAEPLGLNTRTSCHVRGKCLFNQGGADRGCKTILLNTSTSPYYKSGNCSIICNGV